MYVVGMVETTLVSVVMASQVVSSVVKRDIASKNVLKIRKVVEMKAECSLYQLLHQTVQHIEDVLSVLEEWQTAFMQSLVTKSKTTLHMLSLV